MSGIDVSAYQGEINYGQVQSSGITWVGIRALHQSKDIYFDRNRAGFGWARHRLLYHFLDPFNPDAQADKFLQIIGNLQPGECAMLDAEAGLGTDDAIRWCDHVEQHTGRPVAVYTGGYVDNRRMWTDTRLNNGNRARIFAAYTNETSAKSVHAQGIPWDAWQYSSSGFMAGIHGAVDLDRVDNQAAFDRCCGVAPPPPPDPTWDPLHHKYGDMPTRPKPELHFGDGYAAHQDYRDLITYLKLVEVIEAGQNTYGSSWFVFELYAIAAMQNIQRFFGLPVLDHCDAATWAVIDFLAGPRPR